MNNLADLSHDEIEERYKMKENAEFFKKAIAREELKEKKGLK